MNYEESELDYNDEENDFKEVKYISSDSDDGDIIFSSKKQKIEDILHESSYLIPESISNRKGIQSLKNQGSESKTKSKLSISFLLNSK
ncbi:hypothetical protein AYI68_g2884 [Smittium mucronatum]|uniref:Uncharacterized protein n=1 Tax=Smittium mucronatum TaxID=133383 RepID=A0A1R0H1H0_9FUNG|nr:hypothetical protein AYI68_g2884 [Smittium mucronatum]